MQAVIHPKAPAGYGMTTANILYRLPDHPGLLQQFLWQHYDMAPDFPRLINFLRYWRDTLDGALHTVEISHKNLARPGELRIAKAQYRLN